MFLKVSKIITLLILIILASFPAQVLALGLGVSPSRLSIDVSPGDIAREMLYVSNSSDEESQFQVYVDEEYKEWISITPGQFILAPNLNEGVEITASPPDNVSGEYDCIVYVVSTSSGADLQIGAGIKIPTQIHVGTNVPGEVAGMEDDVSRSPAFIIVLVIEILLVIVLSVIVIRRRMQSSVC